MAQIIGEWGGSAAIRIPVAIMQRLNLKKGDAIEIDYQDGKAVITPAQVPQIIHARDLFKDWRGQQVKQIRDEEWLNAAPCGAEKW